MKYSFVAVVWSLVCVVSALASPSPHWKKHATSVSFIPHQTVVQPVHVQPMHVQPVHVQIVPVPVYTKTIIVDRPVASHHSGWHAHSNKKHGIVSSPAIHTQQYEPKYVAPPTVHYVRVPQQVTYAEHVPAPTAVSGHEYNSGHSGFVSGHAGVSFDLHKSWGKTIH